MADRLQPHPLAALFPELPPEELTELARDIKARGQLEPIIVYKGLILDGRNRYLACQKAGVKASDGRI
jgi:ParB-like chromosome segregation protein Spo0J